MASPEWKNGAHDYLCTLCINGSVLNAVRHRCKWNATAPSLLSAIEHGAHRLLHIEDWIDAFICPSQFLAAKLEHRVPKSRIHHIPNPIAIPEQHPPQKKQWLVAGRLSPEKV